MIATFRITQDGRDEGTIEAGTAKEALELWLGADGFQFEPDATTFHATITLTDGRYSATRIT
jgi:hypothetical protein